MDQQDLDNSAPASVYDETGASLWH
jgi:hypothetical protein